FLRNGGNQMANHKKHYFACCLAGNLNRVHPCSVKGDWRDSATYCIRNTCFIDSFAIRNPGYVHSASDANLLLDVGCISCAGVCLPCFSDNYRFTCFVIYIKFNSHFYSEQISTEVVTKIIKEDEHDYSSLST